MYKASKATDIKICVTGSVEGVIIAANTVDKMTIYFQADNIFSPDTIFKSPKIICIIGT